MTFEEKLEFLFKSTESLHASLQEAHASLQEVHLIIKSSQEQQRKTDQQISQLTANMDTLARLVLHHQKWIEDHR